MLTDTPALEKVACDLCGAVGDVPVYFKDVGQVQYRIGQCAACGLVYVNPRHFAVEHDDYFRGPYLSMIEEDGKLRKTIETIYAEVVGHLEAYLQPGRLLDVGCAMGHFMNFARQHGWEVTGMECSRYASAWARDHFFLRTHPVCNLSKAQFPSDYCDAAVLIEVVEHLPSPRQTLTEVFRVLKPGGVVCLTTPNFTSYRSLLMREEWAPIIPSGHLYYFTSYSLRALLQSIGFSQVVDLTKPASFDADLYFAMESRKLRLDSGAVEELRARLAREDAGRISNGRGEGLILCAQKPLARGLRASRRSAGPPETFEGELITEAGEGARAFYVQNGVRHWVTSAEWIAKRGLRFPEDVLTVSWNDLSSLPEGPSIEPPGTMTRPEMLARLGGELSGSGVEFGAGIAPLPVPAGVSVRYADRNTAVELEARQYFGDSKLVPIDLQADLDDMKGIESDSLDFIIASHVIEHTCNPLRALQEAYRTLRKGGKLVLVIPDKEQTLDHERVLTSLDHLILDFEEPSRERDWEHYLEFFTLALPQPDPDSHARRSFEENHDIHFHTWTYASFGEMVEYARGSISPWSSVRSHPRLSPQEIEFFYVLTK